MASERKRRANRRRRTRLAQARALTRTPLGPVQPIVQYAEEHVGEPYEWGGESKNGRARCPACGRTEKTRADGTMGKHTALDKRTDCEGVGTTP